MATHVVCTSPALVQRTPPDFSLSFLYLTLEVGAGGVNGQKRPQSWNHIGSTCTAAQRHIKRSTFYNAMCTVTTSEAPFCVCKENISEAVCTIKTYYIILKALTHC